MLRASSQGLSLALPTVTRALLPWKVAYSTASLANVLRIERVSSSSTGSPRQVTGEDVFPKRPHVLRRNARRIGPISHGQSESASTYILAKSTQQYTPLTPYCAKSGIGPKKPREKERDTRNRRIRSLRSLPPRFCRIALEKTRNRLSYMATKQRTTGHVGSHVHSNFRGQSGSVPRTSQDIHITSPFLRAIDAASIARELPSPAATVARHLLELSEGRVLQYVWESYVDLTRIQSTHPVVGQVFPASRIPPRLLWRLFHFINHSRPVTTAHFPSLLAVSQHLWDMKKKPSISEWNSLISMAAKRQRRGGFTRSLALLNDFVKDRRPGSSFGDSIDISSLLDPSLPNQPDIYTLSILIHIASDNLNVRQLRDATLLLDRSGLAPTRITHLSLVKFYAHKKQLSGVRNVIRRLHEDGMELGTDGVNTCLWAYALNGQTQITLDIYRVLRHNIEPDCDPQAIDLLRRNLETYEHIYISPDTKLDHRTYIVLIQTMAYHGNFSDTFTILSNFLETTHRGRLDPSTAPAFRAVFMGFSKYAVSRLEESVTPNHPQNKWNLANLRRVYRLFLKFPKGVIPSRTTIYWILVAFDKTSDHDVSLLRELWLELEDRYTPMAPLLFRQARLQRIKAILFPRPHR